MPPTQLACHLSGILGCTLLEETPCDLCQKYRDFQSAIVQAKARVLEAEQALRELEERERRFSRTYNERHDQLTGVFPTEIVAQIFQATLTRELRSGMKDHVIDSPLYLGAICRRWRKIAWSTPTLWNWIHIFLCRPANKHLEATVQEWIERSGQLPLTIQITCGKGVADVVNPELFFPNTGIFGNFVAHINACSARWENVSFTGPSATTDFLSGCQDGSPNLQVLRVNTTDGSHHQFDLEELSRPHSIVFGELPDPDAWDAMNIAWDNVVNLHLERFVAQICVETIQRMPRLIECVLICNGQENTGPHSRPTQRFIHPNLQKFTYKTRLNGSHSLSLLDHFNFPSLTDLCITTDGGPPGLFHFVNGQMLSPYLLWEDSIKPFIIQCSSKLTTLMLQAPLEYYSLERVLAGLDVCNLDLPCFIHFHPFLVHLANAPPNPPRQDDPSPEFLEGLQSLSLSGHIDEAVFEAILNACRQPSDPRNPARRSLRRMVVTSTNSFQINMSEENIRQVSEITRAGITLQVIDRTTGEDVTEPYRLPLEPTIVTASK